MFRSLEANYGNERIEFLRESVHSAARELVEDNWVAVRVFFLCRES